jgi:hypothetical protein
MGTCVGRTTASGRQTPLWRWRVVAAPLVLSEINVDPRRQPTVEDRRHAKKNEGLSESATAFANF